MSLRDELSKLAAQVGKAAATSAAAIERLRLEGRDYRVLPYRGYGSGNRALVLGRVLRAERIAAADPTHPRWRNALHMLQRLEADPLAGAVVQAEWGTTHDITADGEGFLHQWLRADRAPDAHGWLPVPTTLAAGPHGPASHAVAHVLFPPPTARFGVISDMDDTVLQSSVDNVLRAAQLMLFSNARTRLPFPGVAAFYRALHRGANGAEGNPIFYVSSSPWNLYDVIEEFLDSQKIPAGPLLLRDWDSGRSVLRNREHKLALIREVFSTYSGMPFILVGDTTQEDPEIYSALVHEYPGRILAVYIRSMRPHPDRSAAIAKLATEVERAGSALILADDTLAAATHAAGRGWIPDAALAEIGADAAADEGDGPATEPAAPQ